MKRGTIVLEEIRLSPKAEPEEEAGAFD